MMGFVWAAWSAAMCVEYPIIHHLGKDRVFMAWFQQVLTGTVLYVA